MANYMMRTFHPIGQGAYYSEQHVKSDILKFNIVYDCGEWKGSKRAENLVKKSFPPGSCIDILFISHFDFDHISKIETLRNTFIIKNCVLPLLHVEQVEILKSYFAIQENESAIKLVEDPASYFGGKTKVIHVEFGDDQSESNEIVELGELTSGARIASGKGIKIYDWLYVPFNLNQPQRLNDLKNLFHNSNLDFNLFKTDLAYCMQNKTKINTIYNKLSGGINFNSMLVYSGPAKAGPVLCRHIINHCDCVYDPIYCVGVSDRGYCDCKSCCRYICGGVVDVHRAGCVFTGDSNLNYINLQRVFGKYWQYVGTIQMPHHGDIKSFNAGILKKDRFIFPVSYGTKNSYGHPSRRVIGEIINNYSIPVFINENSCSKYVQIVRK